MSYKNQVLSKEYSSSKSLEEYLFESCGWTVLNWFDIDVDNLEDRQYGKELGLAKKSLSDEEYEKFRRVYFKRLRPAIRAIYILRKLVALKAEQEKLTYLSKFIRPDHAKSVIGIINIYLSGTYEFTDDFAKGSAQVWCLDCILLGLYTHRNTTNLY